MLSIGLENYLQKMIKKKQKIMIYQIMD